VTIELPPLRDRREDLGLLVPTLLVRVAGAGPPPLTLAAARALWLHEWPLNVRELEQTLAAAVALAAGRTIGVEHLAEPLRSRAAVPPPDRLRVELTALLRDNGGNVSAVARALGKARTQVQRWLKRYALEPGQFRRPD